MADEEKQEEQELEEQKEGGGLDEERVSEWLRENKGITNLDGLTSALDSERKARKKAEKQLNSYADIDPERYRELLEAAEARETEQLQSEGKWDEMKDRLQKAHDKETTALTEKIGKRDAVIERLTVDLELDRAIDKAEVLPEHRKAVRALLRTEARPTVSWEEGEPRGLMGDVPIAEYVESWAKTDEAAPYMPSSGASGSGARGSGGGTGRKPYREMSEQDKIDFIDQHGKDEFLKHMMATK